jgi:hypothetical protein
MGCHPLAPYTKSHKIKIKKAIIFSNFDIHSLFCIDVICAKVGWLCGYFLWFLKSLELTEVFFFSLV